MQMMCLAPVRTHTLISPLAYFDIVSFVVDKQEKFFLAETKNLSRKWPSPITGVSFVAACLMIH